jgi:Ribonuclease toxin, BrnT, of type II toxin-antitoxin system
VFFNRPLVVAKDLEHSRREKRFYALGQTDAGRDLFVVFKLRKRLIRVISARDMNGKKRKLYQHHEEDTKPLDPKMKNESFGAKEVRAGISTARQHEGL